MLTGRSRPEEDMSSLLQSFMKKLGWQGIICTTIDSAPALSLRNVYAEVIDDSHSVHAQYTLLLQLALSEFRGWLV